MSKYPNFDSIKFTDTHLPFFEDFLGEYEVIYNRLSLKLFDLKQSLLLRVLLMKHVGREKYVQTENELTSKFVGYQRDLSKVQVIIESLQKEKDALVTKINETETKAQDPSTSEKRLYASLDDYLFSKKKKVEEDVYMLKEKLVETSKFILST